ncbi:undecaprenyl-diphosphate phosphatase [Candidatus Neomicrothrix sp.]|jgi:undecaprenyl-diphosphatase|uniref:undecaprenyl-diphosphate phosphatase n=1 Tax=Candidatus Neomicrothrix sp. TaxID=2719034 RepID=UPI001D340F73|nr:undecaprenyl-diphosphate phosphatase [Candidatus Microthrix sp.]MBK6437386.1 undecaprenyl-diphosphate phosphatase [Candidatus Microthrix sp.]HMS48565.1 undecaprenyl-diphosphate phosphatase [Candidatus Microthrix sp.]
MISPQTLHHRPPSTPSGSVARAALRAAAAAVLIMVVLLVAPKPSGASDTTADTTTDATAAGEQMTVGKAAILGVVEGVTEYLPVSSTGHLYVSQQLLGVGDTQATKAPADSFAIVIQAGAILAVLILYRRRILSVFQGVIGRSAEGRTVGIALVVAFLPAAIIGVLAEDAIKSKLFAGWPIVVAWAVGGVAILVLADRLQHRRPSDAAAVDGAAGGTQSAGRANVIGTALEAITPRQALIIGLAQVVAMWPGTSRSLVTIVAAVLVGLSVSAAVEFSFLLGLGTLGAATAYEALKNGSLLVDSYGGAEIVIGLVVAFITAAVAITWMVRWLERRSLAIFGWYRLAIAGVGAVLLLTGTITSTPG